MEGSLDCVSALRGELPEGVPVFSSPLRRCRRLAERLHAAPIVDDRLIEMDFGTWEMRPWAELPRHELDAWAAAPLDYAPPGGEAVGAVRQRVVQFLAARRGEGHAEIAVVTHAGVMKLLAAHVLGLPPEQWLGLAFEHGRIFVLDVRA